MKIFIAGDGETGSHLARMLSLENQDVILLGSDRDHLEALEGAYNFQTIEGNAISMSTLANAGAGEADLFAAVTPYDTTNIISAQMAKELGAVTTVARVGTDELAADPSTDLFRRCGVDSTVYPEMLAAAEICSFMEHNGLSRWFEMHGSELIVAGAKLHTGAPLDGLQLRELGGGARTFHVSAIRRGNNVIIPRGSDTLTAGDTLYFTIGREQTAEVMKLCGTSHRDIHKIVIAGAGSITDCLLGILPDRIEATVIDADRSRCKHIAYRHGSRVTVVNADVRELPSMREENMTGADMFLALTGSSETNIVTSMVARELGAHKTVARIEELQYTSEAESLNIDKIINKKLLTSGAILRSLLDRDLSTPRCLALENAEVAEIVVMPGSRITHAKVADLGLSRDMTIGALLRDGKRMLVDGSTHIQTGDHAVVFCSAGALDKVERMFK